MKNRRMKHVHNQGGHLLEPGQDINKLQQREYGKDGLSSSLHILMRIPQRSVFDFLISLKIPAEKQNYDKETPFYVFCDHFRHMGEGYAYYKTTLFK